VASPDQVSALLAAVARTRPEQTAFFGCLYYAALRPEEAVALRIADCHLPSSGWGMLRLASAAPRTAAAWTTDGTGYEQRGLKHRPDGAIRMVPVPPVLAAMLRAHHAVYGSAPDGRLFRGTRGGPLSESVYGRAWHAARALALAPEVAASGLARRPYDLRHAALSLWLNTGGNPAQIAARAGNSVAVLLTVYSHGHDDLLNQQIGHVLKPFSGSGPCPSVESQRLQPTTQLRRKRLHDRAMRADAVRRNAKTITCNMRWQGGHHHTLWTCRSPKPPGNCARPHRTSSKRSTSCWTTTPTPRSPPSSTPAATPAAKAAPSTP